MKRYKFAHTWVIQLVQLVYLNGNNAAEGENNIKYASSYPMNRTVKIWFVYSHDRDKWSDYVEDNVPFERLEKVYVPNEDSLEQRLNISMASSTVFTEIIANFVFPFSSFFDKE